MHIRFLFALAGVLLAICPDSWALGLGEARVHSFLNQPLNVRIGLIVRPNDDIDSVTARLASAEDFALVGASLDAISVPLDFSIEEEGGAYFIRMTSALAVSDPVVRVIVEVDWSSGRMLREYTLLLDPPTFESAAPAPRVDEPSRDSVAAPTEPASPPAVSERPRTADVYAGDQYGPVQSGETLWSIASGWAEGTDLDINQVMVAIQQRNPGAFLNNNINLLQRGATLQMPAHSEIRRLSEAEARSEVAAQGEQFIQRAPDTAEELPLFSDDSEQAASVSDAPPVEPEDRLELVPADSVAESAGEMGADAAGPDAPTASLREELARAEEQLISEQQQNRYLQERIAELESELADRDDGLAATTPDAPGEGLVEDGDLGAMQQRLEAERIEDSRVGADPAQAEPVPATTRQPAESGSPWYASLTLWLIILLVAGAGAAVWYFRRQDADAVYVSDLGDSDDDAVRTMIDDAEEIHRVLTPTDEAPAEPGADVDSNAEGEVAAAEDEELAGDHEERAPTRPSRDEGDATVLDEESADPEIKLDLARAYVSMGDKEAARAILDEVMEYGDDEQKEEARKMREAL